jgi:hypothetical protein
LFKVDMNSGTAENIPFRLTARHRVHAANRAKLDLAPARVDVKIVRQIALSPDGSEIVFRALGSLWRQPMHGNAIPRRLTAGKGAETDPAWSADGRRIVYVDWNDETGSTVRVFDARHGGDEVVLSSRVISQRPFPGRRTHRLSNPRSRFVDGGCDRSTGLYLAEEDGQNALPVQDDRHRAVRTRQPSIYFTEPADDAAGARSLSSVRLDGTAAAACLRGNRRRRRLLLSPDLKWLAFRKQELYPPAPTGPEAVRSPRRATLSACADEVRRA